MNETNPIGPLRQRTIEDITARKLDPYTQRSHISSFSRFAAQRTCAASSCASSRAARQHLQPQPDRDWVALSVRCHANTAELGLAE
jgi:hypothetical protein